MKKALGILGGMGPMATVDLFHKIVAMTDAACDNDHMRIYIDCNAAIPDRTAAILSGGRDPMPYMRDSLQTLLACGAELIIMPCNTAHFFLPRLQAESPVPFLSMPAVTAEACARLFPGKTAAILATRGTLAAGIYKDPDEAVAHMVRYAKSIKPIPENHEKYKKIFAKYQKAYDEWGSWMRETSALNEK